jgi:hypothetical protein
MNPTRNMKSSGTAHHFTRLDISLPSEPSRESREFPIGERPRIAINFCWTSKKVGIEWGRFEGATGVRGGFGFS